MWKNVIVLSLLFGINTLACPDLSGVFTCTLSVGDFNSKTTQATNAAGVTTYKMYNNLGKLAATWIADGEVREMIGCSRVMGPGCFKTNTKVSFTCKDNQLVLHEILTQYRPTGELSFTLETINKMSINSENNWQTDFINVNSDGSQSDTKTQICIRKQ